MSKAPPPRLKTGALEKKVSDKKIPHIICYKAHISHISLGLIISVERRSKIEQIQKILKNWPKYLGNGEL